MEKDCIFCKIISGNTSAHTVYEDDVVMAILDIDPITDGHTLVLPKKHMLDIHSIDEETGVYVLRAARLIADALKEKFRFEGVTIMQTNGIFQDVPHFHLHVFGRNQSQDITIQYPVGINRKKTYLAQILGQFKEFLIKQ